MKKIFTLLVSVTMAAAAFAQYDGSRQRDNGYNYDKDYDKVSDNDYAKNKDVFFNDGWNKKHKGRFNDSYSFTKRELQMEIAQVNQEYDRKVRSVKMNFLMPRFKKQQIVNRLEDQRQFEIKMLYVKFNDRKNRANNDHGYGSRKN